eukprot:maker-scaffold_7-snap-gene-16.2-mRNA-1 protein AED:0.12 eAED:0.12 QI:0/0/0/0.66/1/1/3/0/1089
MQAGFYKPQILLCTRILPVHLKYNERRGKWDCRYESRALFEDGPMFSELGKAIEKGDFSVSYIGVPPCDVPPEQQEIVSRLLRAKNCYPIFISKKLREDHFNGYCKQVLWPLFHNFVDKSSGSTSDGVANLGLDTASHWPAYYQVNSRFAQKVVEVYRQNCVIWVHDYHLLLMPGFLMRRLPQANVSLFMHVPFPSSEIFRIFPKREDILRAMLCADHIGFHLFEYSRHFISSCKRLLAISSEGRRGGTLTIKHSNRNIIVSSVHAGINPDEILKLLRNRRVLDLAATYHHKQQSRYNEGPGRVRVILGINEVERLQGISSKLIAFSELLALRERQKNPEKVILRQIGIRCFASSKDYANTKGIIMKMIKSIKDRFGDVIQYEEHTAFSLSQRIAAYVNADVFLLTPWSEGLNMMPLEFIVANKLGTVVVSQFAAVSRILQGSVKIHPVNTSYVAKKLDLVLRLPKTELIARNSRNMTYILENTISTWADVVLEDILQGRRMDDEQSKVPLESFGLGVGVSSLNNGSRTTSSKRFDSLKVRGAYKAARRRLIIIDYSGTLVEATSVNKITYSSKSTGQRSWFYKKGSRARPSAALETRDPLSSETRAALTSLTLDKNNHVFLVSTDLREELAAAVVGIPNLGLIAENGYVFRLSPTDEWEVIKDTSLRSSGGDWYGAGNELENFSLSDDWQEKVKKIMQPFTERTTCSFFWTAPSAVSFNTVFSDPEMAILQSNSIFNELEAVLSDLPLSIEIGKGYVTVRLAGVNRGAAAITLLSKLNSSTYTKNIGKIDFVLGFGNDVEDEVLFSDLLRIRKKNSGIHVFPIRVGPQTSKTKAKYFLEGYTDVLQVLSDFSNDCSTNRVRISSSLMLTEEAANFVTKKDLMGDPFTGRKSGLMRRNKVTPGVLPAVKEADKVTESNASLSKLSATSPSESGIEKPSSRTFKLSDTDLGPKFSKKISKAPYRKMTRNVSFQAKPQRHVKSSLKKSKTMANLSNMGSESMGKLVSSPSYVASEAEMEILFGRQGPRQSGRKPRKSTLGKRDVGSKKKVQTILGWPTLRELPHEGARTTALLLATLGVMGVLFKSKAGIA